MAICPNKHYYDDTRFTHCQDCEREQAGAGRGRSPAPSTVFEEGGVAAGAGGGQRRPPPAPVYGGPPFDAQPGGAPPTRPDGGPMPPHRPMPARPGNRTIMDDDVVEAPRLMGFLVIAASKDDDEYRYFRLRKGINRIGKFGSRAEIELRDGLCSQEHALVLCTRTATRAIDLDSTNGLFVNGDRVELALLAAGDRLKVGRTELVFVPFDFVADD